MPASTGEVKTPFPRAPQSQRASGKRAGYHSAIATRATEPVVAALATTWRTPVTSRALESDGPARRAKSRHNDSRCAPVKDRNFRGKHCAAGLPRQSSGGNRQHPFEKCGLSAVVRKRTMGIKEARQPGARIIPISGKSLLARGKVLTYFAALLWADVAKLADALDSKSCVLTDVWVRPPPSAPSNSTSRTSLLLDSVPRTEHWLPPSRLSLKRGETNHRGGTSPE